MVFNRFSYKSKRNRATNFNTCKDIKPDAVKIGMLHSSEVILSILKALKKINTKKIVLDPVMVAKGGAKLINESAIKILKNY